MQSYNGIYRITECHGMCRSLDELIKSRSVHLNRLASINIKPQKHYLNMNPACASLLMNDTDVWFHLLHTYILKSV